LLQTVFDKDPASPARALAAARGPQRLQLDGRCDSGVLVSPLEQNLKFTWPASTGILAAAQAAHCKHNTKTDWSAGDLGAKGGLWLSAPEAGVSWLPVDQSF
jgi:hypothetical protein